jgi:hypothetical protein
MATTSTGIAELYSDIVADLVPYYMDAVLLPNQNIIVNSLQISGEAGDTVKFPLTNAYVNAGTVGEGNSIASTGAVSDFDPTSVSITVAKRGVATDVTEEALEDGGLAVVRNAVLTRLAGGLAQATDIAGLAQAKTGATLADTGEGSSANTHTTNFVMSPEALGFASKREPSVRMWYDVDLDKHLFRGSVRNGFITLRGNFINPVTANTSIGSATANITAIAKAVSQLRQQNAPVGSDGMYVSIIDPALEFAINEQVSLAGGQAIGSLSDIGNRALMQGLVGQAAGVMFFRSNNLPDAS